MALASIVTRVVLDVDRVISAGSITVYGIILANSAGLPAEIVIEDGSGAVRITVTVPALDSEIIDFAFLADQGLTVSGVGSASVFATVFHSSVGS